MGEQDILRQLVDLGLQNGLQILKHAPKSAPLDVPGYVVPKIEFFRSLGFKRPIRLIDQRPAILFIDRERLKVKIGELKLLGFRDPVKMIDLFPTLSAYDVAGNIATKIGFLKSQGFRDPVRMFENMPAALSIDLESRLQPHLAQLSEIGFSHPQLLIERAPSILFFGIADKIVPKITFLRTLGFQQPLTMIERRPSLLVLSPEDNIAPSVRELEAWGYSLVQIEQRPSLIASSLARIRPLREFLVSLSFAVETLPTRIKRGAIESLSADDLRTNLAEQFPDGSSAWKTALSRPENWAWIFKKSSSAPSRRAA